MSFRLLTHPFPWSRYSKKLIAKIETPHCIGYFTTAQSEERGMRLACGQAGSVAEGNIVRLYWLVDLDDGKIVDARFQLYGQSALIGATEVACELVIGKTYDQARRMGAELIDQYVRDRPDIPAFPTEAAPHLNLVIDAMEQAAMTCMDIPLPLHYSSLPLPAGIGNEAEGGYAGWESLGKGEKLALIEEVIARDVRPYIELDAGGIEVVDLKEGNALHIAYQGSCTSCFSATGTTLSYIQHVLRSKLDPSLVVIPQL